MIDPRIPMMVQQPNVLAALDAGTQAAGNQNALMRQAEGQNLFRQYGAGAMQGDQNALAQIARFDPMMGQGMQSERLNQQATGLRMDFTREQIAQARREAASAAAAAKDAKAAAAELERGRGYMRFLGQAYLTGDTETWDVITGELGVSGIPMNESSLEFVDGILTGFGEGLSGIGGQKQGFRNATPEEAGQYGAQAGQFGPDGRFYPINPPQGMVLESDGAGGFRMAQGAGVSPDNVKFTEGQSKDNVYATRAEGALALLDSVGAEALADRGAIIADAVPLGLARGLQPQEFQVAQQAGEEFLQAILRKDTGAAITAQEQDLYGKTYLPQPGDGPQVLEAKRQARIRAIEALKAGMNIQQITVTERALIQAADRAGTTQTQVSPAPQLPADAVNMLRQDPSPEAMAEFDEIFGEGAAARALGQ